MAANSKIDGMLPPRLKKTERTAWSLDPGGHWQAALRKDRPFLRALLFLWRRMGAARIYVAVAAGALLLLAGVGLMHLLSPRTELRESLSTNAPAPETSPTPGVVSRHEPIVRITEVRPIETHGRLGQTKVEARIGVAPRPNASGRAVEIRVSFFDVTENGEMRPTTAQVDYKWITQVRDWKDPSPKYLTATYRGRRPSRRAPERLEYGGFVVRVYVDGQLQDERTEPEDLLARLRNKEQPVVAAATAAPTMAPRVIAPAPPLDEQPKEVRAKRTVAAAPSTTPALPGPSAAASEGPGSAPYARPVPDKPGFVYSPHNEKFLIDVRGVPPGTEVNDPNTNKPFKVP